MVATIAPRVTHQWGTTPTPLRIRIGVEPVFVQGMPEIIPLLSGSGVGYPAAAVGRGTLETALSRSFAPTRDAPVSGRHQEFISELPGVCWCNPASTHRDRGHSYWSTPRMFLPSSMSA